MTFRYGSVCSGIEAATAAWHPIGWEPAWFCEIDAFPSAVLAHHHPQVTNYGDFTSLLDPTHPARHGDPIDLLVGGTPCQSFSHAGGRAGLDDPRGQLMLRYLDLVGVLRPRWIVWENVPGVLSSNGGRDFGALLGGLADLGYGVAYRVLDARFFGVPQRRRRVFVVGHSGGDPERAARVLALDEGVRGHSAARGGARKEAAAAVGSGAAVGGGQVTSFVSTMQSGNDGGVYDDGTIGTLRAKTPHAIAGNITSFTAAMGGNDGGVYADGTVATLRGGGGGNKLAVAVAPTDCVGFQNNLGSHGGAYMNESVTLKAVDGGGGGNPAAVVVTQHVSTYISTSGDRRSPVKKDWIYVVPQDFSAPIDCGGANPETIQGGTIVCTTTGCVGFQTRGTNLTVDAKVMGTLSTNSGCASGGAPMVLTMSVGIPDPAYRVAGRQFGRDSQDTYVIAKADADRGDQDNLLLVAPPLITDQRGHDGHGVAPTLRAKATSNDFTPMLLRDTVVRRLTPRECERLQGFPDDHTLIPWKGKPATDGHRYKALGNSMAVPVMRWIGERIEKEDKQ